MRGKVLVMMYIVPHLRITPAHAGKRENARPKSCLIKDHPRTCGEKRGTHSEGDANLGSPPHMRGKGPRRGLEQIDFRITPAHAGKRYAHNALIISAKDHPRTCGEKRANTAKTMCI